MLLVIPCSREDQNLVPDTIKAFEICPPGGGHQLLVVGCPMVATKVAELCFGLAPYFTDSKTYIFDTDNVMGWPMACNYYFQQTCYKISKTLKPEEAFFWYEMDSVPLEEGWLSTIANAYFNDIELAQREGRPRNHYMGVVQDTYLPVGGKLVPFSESGVQMAAVGVYPGDIVNRVKTLKTITSSPKPWYEFIRWYTCHLDLCLNTGLIQNNWKTKNYRYEGDVIVCDSDVNWAWDKHFNDPVREDAVLLHGQKDGSLLKLLLRGDEDEDKLTGDAKDGVIEGPKIPRSYRSPRSKLKHRKDVARIRETITS